MKTLTILGSTGSIGQQALEVVRNNKRKFKVIGLSCNNNLDLFLKQYMEFKPKYVAIANSDLAKEFKSIIKDHDVQVFSSFNGILELSKVKVDILLHAVVGFAGMNILINALDYQKNIALANKESIVCAGKYIMSLVREKGVNIYPVDSEHSAIWKCLGYNLNKKHKRILITASGGAFRDLNRQDLDKVTYKDAIKHPTWVMGEKITVDSATLMNKGFEVIEAIHLFNTTIDKIEVVIHKESIIHSMVEYDDNTIIAELSYPNMKIPIQTALMYPKKYCKNQLKSIDFVALGKLTFEKPNLEKDKCLAIALKAAKLSGLMPCVLCVANDLLVEYLKEGVIKFTEIAKYIEIIIEKLKSQNIIEYTLEDLHEIIALTKSTVKELVENEKKNFN